eukprot:1799767-Prymnesium_polylepis.1
MGCERNVHTYEIAVPSCSLKCQRSGVPPLCSRTTWEAVATTLGPVWRLRLHRHAQRGGSR